MPILPVCCYFQNQEANADMLSSYNVTPSARLLAAWHGVGWWWWVPCVCARLVPCAVGVSLWLSPEPAAQSAAPTPWLSSGGQPRAPCSQCYSSSATPANLSKLALGLGVSELVLGLTHTPLTGRQVYDVCVKQNFKLHRKE